MKTMKIHEVCVWRLIHIHGTALSALVTGIAHLIIDSAMLVVVVLVVLRGLVAAAVVVLDGTCACRGLGIVRMQFGTKDGYVLSSVDEDKCGHADAGAVFTDRLRGFAFADLPGSEALFLRSLVGYTQIDKSVDPSEPWGLVRVHARLLLFQCYILNSIRCEVFA